MADFSSKFSYDPASGILLGKKDGKVKGWKRKDGYLEVKFQGKSMLCHRVAWEIMCGPIPDGMYVDHINRIRQDNRLSNLRLLSPKDSQWNISNRFNGGRVGVRFRRGSWHAYITMQGRQMHLGSFKTEQAALTARQDAEKLHWPELAI